MELETNSGKTSIFIVIGAVTAALCLTLIVVGIAWQMGYIGDQISREKDLRGLDLNTGIFTYRQIKAATNNFADSNKLGEGGFGSVYKGTLLDGTLIAVKKLSSKSNQGNREFVNEVGMIAGIQHPNVVRLHGCCVERNQLLLVYEYMENNSLAHALFVWWLLHHYCGTIREMIGSGLEGPIPASISLLSNLEELRISDLGGDRSLFPNLSSMTKMRNLVLRSCNITGKIPDYIAQMSNLKFLDLSFNGLVGDIPNLSGLGDLHTVFVSGNSLNGNYPHWLTNTDVVVDLSYNNFSKETVPQHCTESVNLFRSYAGGNNSDLANCLIRIPCMKNYSYVHVNCGGIEVTIGDKVYQADDRDRGGPARFHPSNDHWGFSSTGNVWNVKNYQYTINNVSRLAMKDSELYTTARLSPLSVSYYGRCLKNGRYKVTLHFAEIVFRDDKSYQSLGRRAFDVYTQGAIIKALSQPQDQPTKSVKEPIP